MVSSPIIGLLECCVINALSMPTGKIYGARIISDEKSVG
jgi:hypothetical protein